MSETKVVVPDGMLKAVQAIAEDYGGVSPYSERGKACYPAVLEAALLWLDGRLAEMCMTNTYPGELTSHAAMVEVWREGIGEVRRMFRAPEPEVPEAVKDLLWDGRPAGQA